MKLNLKSFIFVSILCLFSCSNNAKTGSHLTKNRQIIDIYQNMQKATEITAAYSDSSEHVLLAGEDTVFNVIGKTPDFKWLLITFTPVSTGQGFSRLFYVPAKKIFAEKDLGFDSTWVIDDFSSDFKTIILMATNSPKTNKHIVLKNIQP